MTRLDEHLHDTAEEIRRFAHLIPDHRPVGQPGRRSILAGVALAVLGTLALVAVPLALRAFDTGRDEPPVGESGQTPAADDIEAYLYDKADLIGDLADWVAEADGRSMAAEASAWEGVAGAVYVSATQAAEEHREMVATSLPPQPPFDRYLASIRIIFTDGADEATRSDIARLLWSGSGGRLVGITLLFHETSLRYEIPSADDPAVTTTIIEVQTDGDD
jgi:hypothetical protein